MQSVIGRAVHSEIVRLIDGAERYVYLASPFVRPWPELAMAVGRAVGRGVEVQLCTRRGPGEPSEADLELFRDLEIRVYFLPRMHLKAYISDRAALQTSANLTSEAVDRAVESALWFDEARDHEAWFQVFETWNQALDLEMRIGEPGPGESPSGASDLLNPTPDSFCGACRAPRISGGEYEVFCLKCRAAGWAATGLGRGTVVHWCVRCGVTWEDASGERPLCRACHAKENDPAAQPPPRWYVVGRPGSLEAWWEQAPSEGDIFGARRGTAAGVRRRWWAALGTDGYLSVQLTIPSKGGVDVWREAGLGNRECDGRSGVVLERVPASRPPKNEEVTALLALKPRHVRYEWHSGPPSLVRWSAGAALGESRAEARSGATFEAFLGTAGWVLLGRPRTAPPGGNPLDLDRCYLGVSVVVHLPPGAERGVIGSGQEFGSLLVASLHTYTLADAQRLVSGLPEAVRPLLVERLTAASPLGLTRPEWSKRGRLLGHGARLDRVVAWDIRVEESPRLAVSGVVRLLDRVREAA